MGAGASASSNEINEASSSISANDELKLDNFRNSSTQNTTPTNQVYRAETNINDTAIHNVSLPKKRNNQRNSIINPSNNAIESAYSENAINNDKNGSQRINAEQKSQTVTIAQEKGKSTSAIQSRKDVSNVQTQPGSTVTLQIPGRSSFNNVKPIGPNHLSNPNNGMPTSQLKQISVGPYPYAASSVILNHSNTPTAPLVMTNRQFFGPNSLQPNIQQLPLTGTQSINPQNIPQHIAPPIRNSSLPVSVYSASPVLASALSAPHVGNINMLVAKPNTTVPMSNTTSTVPTHIASYTVKETNAVKRNKASIPQQLTHAKPTTGDWLNKRYIVNNYILLDILGEGSYAEVRLCKERTSDALFAMKIISKEMLNKKKGGNNSETFFDDIKREIAIMKKLLHPNVLRLFEVLDDPKVNKLYLVLEYMKRGDLFKVLQERVKLFSINNNNNNDGSNESNQNNAKPAQGPYFTELELWNIFKQVAAGLRYLHLQNVIHGDIKPQNLLLSDNGIVKIADFGISRMLVNKDDEDEDVGAGGGTPAFMAPELCGGCKKSVGDKDKEKERGFLNIYAADMWAFGATIFMLIYGHPPFVAGNAMLLYHKIKNDPLVFPSTVMGTWVDLKEPNLKDLLVNMLQKEVNSRYSLQQSMTHGWMKYVPQPQSQSTRPNGMVPSQKTPEKFTIPRPSNSPSPRLTSPNYNPSTSSENAAQSQSQNGCNQTLSPNKSGASRAESPSNSFVASNNNNSFAPPATYDVEEQNATKEKIEPVSKNEIYMSISMGQSGLTDAESKNNSEYESSHESELDTIDEKYKSSHSNISNAGGQLSEHNNINNNNIMATNWGDDVFDIIKDHDEVDSDDDSDDDTIDNDNDDSIVPLSKKDNINAMIPNIITNSGSGSSKSNSNNNNNNNNNNKQSTTSTVSPKTSISTAPTSSSLNTTFNKLGTVNNKLMTKEEEELRSKRFSKSFNPSSVSKGASVSVDTQSPRSKTKATNKLSARSDISSDSDTVTSLPAIHSARISSARGEKSESDSKKLNIMLPTDSKASSARNSFLNKSSEELSKCSTPALYLQNGKQRDPNHSFGNLDFGENEEAAEMSMDDFAHMMDTLTLQNTQRRGKFEEDVDTDDDSNSQEGSSSNMVSPELVDGEFHNFYNSTVINCDSEIGLREYQEDRFVILKDLSTLFQNSNLDINVIERLRQISFLSILDGHSGSTCSEFLSKNMTKFIFQDPLFYQNVDKVLLNSFKLLDEMLLEKLSVNDDPSGSTAICAVFNGATKLLTVACVGDSMCVLSCKKKARILTKMHRIDNVSERSRIEAAGGIIINHRVNGVLAVTRAFGDSQFKSTLSGGRSRTVISVPEIFTESIPNSIDASGSTEFAIFASDGLWDVINAQTAVSFVWKQVLSKKVDLHLIPSLLVRHAISKGSIDNVTAIIIWFNIPQNGITST